MGLPPKNARVHSVSPEREIAVSNQPGKIAYVLLDARLCEQYRKKPVVFDLECKYVARPPELYGGFKALSERAAEAALPGRVLNVRAGIVVTGTEVLTGRITDRNGPWVSERLGELGIEVAHILVVADRRGDLESALRFMAAEGMDLIVTSGGLGPTADDVAVAEARLRAGGGCGGDGGVVGALRAIVRHARRG